MPHTRPTTDLAREGLFNILQNQLVISSLRTLDLFAGTGCISYELSSRGAQELTLVEKDPSMVQFIRKTAGVLRLEHFEVLHQDVFRFLETCDRKFDFIFAGPPYALSRIDDLPQLIFQKELLLPKGWFVLEHTPRNNYQDFPFFRSQRNYGTTIFSIFTLGENLTP
ncbi:MAG: RsmD family RNA methyltransferase [Chitinophagaceae bacterium]